jgi:hypothetical protein
MTTEEIMTTDDKQQKTHDVDPRQGVGKVKEGRQIQIFLKSVVVQLYKIIGLKLKKIKELFTLGQKVKKCPSIRPIDARVLIIIHK